MTVISAIAAAVVLLDAGLVIALIALCFASTRSVVLERVARNAIPLLILLSFGSVVGTLYMEYAALLSPCHLCWWQRVFMYPILFIISVALLKGVRGSEIADYVMALAIPGAAVALYQHLLQVLPSGSLIPCDATNECAVRSVFEFGFVTIPWMAVSVFAAIIFVAIVSRSSRS